jgi:hypothetical protein
MFFRLALRGEGLHSKSGVDTCYANRFPKSRFPEIPETETWRVYRRGRLRSS